MRRKQVLGAVLVLGLMFSVPAQLRADPAELAVREACQEDFIRFTGAPEDVAMQMCADPEHDYSSCGDSSVCRICRDTQLADGVPMIKAVRACLPKNTARDIRASARIGKAVGGEVGASVSEHLPTSESKEIGSRPARR